MAEHRWIDDNIAIDFSLPKGMLWLIEEMEKLDEAEDYAYFNYAESLDCGAKELFVKGKLTQKQWDTLCRKYDGANRQ